MGFFSFTNSLQKKVGFQIQFFSLFFCFWTGIYLNLTNITKTKSWTLPTLPLEKLASE